MKIGILTFHCAYNFGSALQSYALKEYLTNARHDVHIIDYRSPDFDNYRIFRNSSVKSLASDLMYLPRNLKRRNSFQSFWKAHLNLTDRTYQGEVVNAALAKDLVNFDAVICGSDQIWNLDCTQGPLPPFFLACVPDSVRKISYAPSLSHPKFDEENFTATDKRNIARWLDRFDAISVRELSVAQQFQQLTAKSMVETLDPTLLLDIDGYRRIQSPQLPLGLRKGSYIFAYTLWPNAEMNHYVDALAQKHGLTIVYYAKRPIQYHAPSINVWGIGPEDFLSLIDWAHAVVSNSFHATVFSIFYNTPFLTFGTKKSSSRMKTLLSNLGLPSQHLLPPDFRGDTDQEPFTSPLDQDKLDELRHASQAFLTDALN